MKDKLTKKEEAFCRYYSYLRSSRQAAYLAGYRRLPALAGEKLLSKREIRAFVEKLDKQNDAAVQAKAGFRRIAFGSIADAIRLLDGERDELESLDLFMVSDIKIPKGGGMEIKFFDRIKALEALASLETAAGENGSTPFYNALESSAKMLAKGLDELES